MLRFPGMAFFRRNDDVPARVCGAGQRDLPDPTALCPQAPVGFTEKIHVLRKERLHAFKRKRHIGNASAPHRGDSARFAESPRRAAAFDAGNHGESRALAFQQTGRAASG